MPLASAYVMIMSVEDEDGVISLLMKSSHMFSISFILLDEPATSWVDVLLCTCDYLLDPEERDDLKVPCLMELSVAASI